MEKTAEIQTSGLTKYYGSSRGVENIDLTVRRGEIFGFLGPNGAGKTTTIRLLLGLIRPTGGSIIIDGKDLKTARKEILQMTGYLPGDPGFYREISGKDFIGHFLRMRRLQDDETARVKTASLMDRFEIDYNKKIKEYSRGMKQIAGIIQAFAHNPKIVILDEPTSGLDPLMQETFYRLLFEEKEKGTTVFLSSHILQEVERICDRVGIIRKGTLVCVETLETYRTLAGKKVRVCLRDNVPEAMTRLEQLFRPESITRSGDSIEFFFKGPVRELLAYLNTLPVVDLFCESPTLEDFFLGYYREDEKP